MSTAVTKFSSNPTHKICGWCLAVLEGDPTTVSQPGAHITHGVCRDCLSRSKALIKNDASADVRTVRALRVANDATHTATLEELQRVLEGQEEQNFPDFDAMNDEFNALHAETTEYNQALTTVAMKLGIVELRKHTCSHE